MKRQERLTPPPPTRLLARAMSEVLHAVHVGGGFFYCFGGSDRALGLPQGLAGAGVV